METSSGSRPWDPPMESADRFVLYGLVLVSLTVLLWVVVAFLVG